MAIKISLSRIKLVRESNHVYDAISSRHISGPQDAVAIFNQVLDLENDAQEVMCELMLDNSNKVLGVMEITRGTLNASLCHPREVFRGAILHNAASIILCHNHPSGDIDPSREDLAVTERVSKSGKILGIELLDHIIIGNGKFRSLKEEGMVD